MLVQRVDTLVGRVHGPLAPGLRCALLRPGVGLDDLVTIARSGCSEADSRTAVPAGESGEALRRYRGPVATAQAAAMYDDRTECARENETHQIG